MYISKSNLKRSLGKVDPDEALIQSLKAENFRSLMSDEEIADVAQAKTFFQSIDRLLLSFNTIKNEDKYEFLYEGGAPAYHISKDCKKLNASWSNHPIPSEIKERGHDCVKSFRKMISQYLKDGGQLDDEGLWIAIRAEFQIPDNGLARVSIENSGLSDFESVLYSKNIEALKDILNKTCTEMLGFNRSEEPYRSIYNMRHFNEKKIKKLNLNASVEKKELAFMFADLKRKLKMTIIETLKKDNDFDKIEESVLIRLGFVRCRTCFP